MSFGGNPPSTLSDVIRYVVQLLVQCGEADYPHVDGSGKTEVVIGERYIEMEGAPRRVLIVRSQDPGGSVLGPVFEIGARQIGTITEACTVYVWGAETTDDRDRYDDAILLMHRLLACFNNAGVGSQGFSNVRRMNETDIDTFGEEYRFVVSHTWEVPRDDAVDQAVLALGRTSKSPLDPDRPNGDTGMTVVINPILVANERP